MPFYTSQSWIWGTHSCTVFTVQLNIIVNVLLMHDIEVDLHVLASSIPASEDFLIPYTTQLSTRLAHSSIRTYLSAVRNLHVMSGAGDPIA